MPGTNDRALGRRGVLRRLGVRGPGCVQGIWGIVVLTPFYWLVDVTGRVYDPPAPSPHFFCGFFAVALAWQIAFLVIASHPARFPALMIPAMIEKFG